MDTAASCRILLHIPAYCCTLLHTACCSCSSLWVDVGSWGHAAPPQLSVLRGTLTEPSGICLACHYFISVLHILVAYLYWLIGQLKGGRDWLDRPRGGWLDMEGSLLHICIAYLLQISVLHIFIAYLHCMSALHLFVTYLLRAAPHSIIAHLYHISVLHIFIAYLHCRYLLSIFLVCLYCISAFHIFIAHFYCTADEEK